VDLRRVIEGDLSHPVVLGMGLLKALGQAAVIDRYLVAVSADGGILAIRPGGPPVHQHLVFQSRVFARRKPSNSAWRSVGKIWA
jgi:hypothetical protein